MSDNSQPGSLGPFPPGYRATGVLLHVTSLPSPYGIGDVGPAALAWVDCLYEAGQSWWQALPLGPTGYGNSPYQCLSSFAGNGLLISPDGLIEDGLLRASDCQGHADFPRVAGLDKNLKPAARGPTIDPIDYGDNTMKATQLLHDLGQSLWLDNITRDLLDNGMLKHYIDEL
jgi:4-alpha-glucanotransferase